MKTLKEIKIFLIVTVAAAALVWFSYIEYQKRNLDRAKIQAEETSKAFSSIERRRAKSIIRNRQEFEEYKERMEREAYENRAVTPDNFTGNDKL